MIEILCNYTDPPHVHQYPDDWKFGGADGLHPGADPRWKSSTYTYFNGNFQPIYVTQVPQCEDEAIDHFTFVRNIGSSYRPVYLQVKRSGAQPEMMRWVYDCDTDEVERR